MLLPSGCRQEEKKKLLLETGAVGQSLEQEVGCKASVCLHFVLSFFFFLKLTLRLGYSLSGHVTIWLLFLFTDVTHLRQKATIISSS